MASKIAAAYNVRRATTCSLFPVTSTLHKCFSTKQPKAAKKKKYPTYGNVRADDGRVVLIQKTGKERKSNKPRLCSGCGTQVIIGPQMGMTGGKEAVDTNLSKRGKKLARFLDASETPYSYKSGSTTGFLCERCKSLRKDDIWAAYDALSDVSPEVFAKQLSHVVSRRQYGLCLLVVDATDPEHSAMKNMRKSVGKTPCWLVLNKVDLMPRMSIYDVRALRYRVEHVLGTKFVKTFAVSAITQSGIVDLSEALLANLQGKDIFCIGCANTGKTTLVRELSCVIANAVKMTGKQGRRRREIASNIDVTGSHLPGTTLQAVRIPCFSKPGHAIWDTPGVINRKALQYNLFPAHLMEPLARPEKFPIPTRDNNLQSQVSQGFSVLIEAAWMEYESGYLHPSIKALYEKHDDEDDSEIPEETDKKQPTSEPRRLGDPTVLARVDIESIEEGHGVFVQAWLHPSLRVRVCPISAAPDFATIPPDFQKFIEQKMRRPFSVENISIPLKPFTMKGRPRGEFSPGEKEINIGGKYAMDIVFSSLGWLTFSHKAGYTLIPHCVEGSVFSKRRALYPSNLAQLVEENPDIAPTEDALDSEESSRRLREAARVGRHQQGYKDGDAQGKYLGHDNTPGTGFYTDNSYEGFEEFDDDEWF